MMTILSTILGGLFRLMPSVLDIFHKRVDNEHELAMLDKQIELQKLQGDKKRQEIADQTEGNVESSWASALLDALGGQGKPTGVPWVDALSASVRPVLTYWWCLVLYTVAKGIYVYVGFKSQLDMRAFADLILTDFDRQVVASIIGFWFVDRALRKLGR